MMWAASLVRRHHEDTTAYYCPGPLPLTGTCWTSRQVRTADKIDCCGPHRAPLHLGQPRFWYKLNDALHMNLHEPVAAQNTQEFYDAIDPLLNVDKENTKIFMDIRAAHEDTMRDNFGAHPEVRATRLRVYQNAMYSRLRDIVQDGDGKPVEEALNTLHRYAKSLINKHFNEASESQTLHRSSSKTRGSFEYRTTGQINKDLAKTNGDVPQARLIDGTNLEAFGKFLISHAEEQYKLRFGPVSKKE
ncbi:hypothetical protein KEM48_009535 [Puccinia striiformis f. sp. tritici PST-130]|nr:hypothetical protein KEM48_009535 [Puccinia striiformis f. sp. tritici PST-130]